ncbi:hypothetical protein GCM10010441_39390 [Kitasatospora paracochleata]|uniref:Uncharacterized protein n=1 Tax=Kitasatospora paracochleata TaxID=58354 RepID=A0ABT1JAK5_9ACTN|nr:hypothetical protein [Kitasatospora paracochleata]MCP2314239.1 hypothetical protein [Kitasatospora paracochleata]
MTRPVPMLGDHRTDPLDDPAYHALAQRAHDAFEIALHYQDACTPEARQEALHNALATAAPGLVAAALVRLADDPELGLTGEQREYLTDVAAGLDLDTVEDLFGAGGDGATAR